MFLALLTLVSTLQVESLGDCPAADEITRRLAHRLPAHAEAPARAQVFRTAQGLGFSLHGPMEPAYIERRAAKDASCAELAEIAAVVIATWQSELRSASEALPPLPGR